jgi:hypothetical protein
VAIIPVFSTFSKKKKVINGVAKIFLNQFLKIVLPPKT